MRHVFTQAECRKGGRASAEKLTRDHRSAGGKARAKQSTFTRHNQENAPKGYWAWSVRYMRGTTGLKLAMPFQIQYIRPERLKGPRGNILTLQEQRLHFGLYVWKYIWEGLPWPEVPDNALFLEEIARIQQALGHGMPLEHPLDALYCAPNDFCDLQGSPWPNRRQHTMFCQALEKAREYALAMQSLLCTALDEAALSLPHGLKGLMRAERSAGPRKPGQRRPMGSSSPQFAKSARVQRHQYGRPDLHSYDRENILPTRPYRAADAVWLPVPWYAQVSASPEGSPL